MGPHRVHWKLMLVMNCILINNVIDDKLITFLKLKVVLYLYGMRQEIFTSIHYIFLFHLRVVV